MRSVSSIISLLFLASCATITAERDQKITVVTTPEGGASCTVSNGEQTWEIAQTPGTVTVPRAFKKLQVSCSKEGLNSGKSDAEAGTRGRAYGNLLLLGVPALVDAATGAGYEYPDTITVPLTPAGE